MGISIIKNKIPEMIHLKKFNESMNEDEQLLNDILQEVFDEYSIDKVESLSLMELSAPINSKVGLYYYVLENYSYYGLSIFCTYDSISTTRLSFNNFDRLVREIKVKIIPRLEKIGYGVYDFREVESNGFISASILKWKSFSIKIEMPK